MTENFKISVTKRNDSLLLKLSGDFDKGAALKVLETLEENRCGISKVFINTKRLEHIDPFGLLEAEWSTWEQALNAA
ncbi:MAG: hypothetical protein SV686_02565 [Thermodesulfobacteriota bacterium]|jgi:ABC-type transporter Mla MlaB component|nr:hypothetical protein [Thermodesulfobacteriota bacterium]